MDRLESVPEWIRSVIEQRITDGHLEPGDRIGLKSELQAEFRVAGPTLDQALKLLANDGLVSLRRGPKGGVFVAQSQPVLRLGTKATVGEKRPVAGGEYRAARGPHLAPRRLGCPGRRSGPQRPRRTRCDRRTSRQRRDLLRYAARHMEGAPLAAEACRQRHFAFDLPEPPRCSRGSDHRCGLPRHRARSFPGASTDRGACQLVPRRRRRRHRARPGVRRGREDRLAAGSRWSSCHNRVGVTETSLGDGRIRRTVPKTWRRIDSTHSAWAHWLEYQPFPGAGISHRGREHGWDWTSPTTFLLNRTSTRTSWPPLSGTSVRRGFDGVNVTYPFKQAALELVDLAGPGVNSIGAVNTLVFGPDHVVSGFNTDHSGLQRRWRERMGAETPGTVAIIGAGGVGRAAAFAFAGLGAEEIRVSDLDPGRAAKLVDDLVRSFPGNSREPSHPGSGCSSGDRDLQRDTSRYALLAWDSCLARRDRRNSSGCSTRSTHRCTRHWCGGRWRLD